MKPESCILTWTSPSLPLTSTSPSVTTSPTFAWRPPVPPGRRRALPSTRTMTPAWLRAAAGAACAGDALGAAGAAGGVCAHVAADTSSVGRQPTSERLNWVRMRGSPAENVRNSWRHSTPSALRESVARGETVYDSGWGGRDVPGLLARNTHDL